MDLKIIISIVNVILILINLFVAKIYTKFSKSPGPNFDALKMSISIACTIITFLLTFAITMLGLFKTLDPSNETITQISNETYEQLEEISQSNTVAYWNIGISIIIMILKVEYDLFTFLQLEKYKADNYKSYDGVFAVSSIIVTKDIRFVLVKRKGENDNLWLQPGVYYRTNSLRSNATPLPSFYEQIKNCLEVECGLTENMYELIQLNSIVSNETSTVMAKEINVNNVAFKDNQLSPTPFVIQKEKAKSLQLSKTKIHIDGFYAFKLLVSGSDISKTLQNNLPLNS